MAVIYGAGGNSNLGDGNSDSINGHGGNCAIDDGNTRSLAARPTSRVIADSSLTWREFSLGDDFHADYNPKQNDWTMASESCAAIGLSSAHSAALKKSAPIAIRARAFTAAQAIMQWAYPQRRHTKTIRLCHILGDGTHS